MMKVVKQIMSTAHQAEEDAHLVMLAYRVMPRGPGRLSLAKTMTQHKFRALLPVKQHLPAYVEVSKEVMIQQKQKQAEYYYYTVQQLPELQQNQLVHTQLNPGQPTWQTVMITRTPTNRNSRAYPVKTSLSPVYQKQKVYPPSSGACQSRTNHTRGTCGTTCTMVDRALSPTWAPSVHTATTRITSPQPLQWVWVPQKLIEEIH